ncbi:uncharacterized protein PAC_18154 [Phialocephala subalpina]|uniref:Uncharacterized protein n=1 Tax=Phialocephala subalpina TaxID=576137 RepID=A0A1L7XTC8_9HELO|nr:uncharacterized protein PAC_18154 [Phialocephala subalpina]
MSSKDFPLLNLPRKKEEHGTTTTASLVNISTKLAPPSGFDPEVFEFLPLVDREHGLVRKAEIPSLANYIEDADDRERFISLVLSQKDAYNEACNNGTLPKDVMFLGPNDKEISILEWFDFITKVPDTKFDGREGKGRRLGRKWINEANRREWLYCKGDKRGMVFDLRWGANSKPLGQAYFEESIKRGEDLAEFDNDEYPELLDDIRSLLCHMSEQDGTKLIQLLISLSTATIIELEEDSSQDSEGYMAEEATLMRFEAPGGIIVTVDEAEEVFDDLADLEDYSLESLEQMERLAKEIVFRFTENGIF